MSSKSTNKFQVIDEETTLYDPIVSTSSATPTQTAAPSAAQTSRSTPYKTTPVSSPNPNIPPPNISTTQSAVSIEAQITNFVKKNNPKLFILTPCYASQCFVNYVGSLIRTIDAFRQVNFPLQVEFCRNDSLVSRARNNLIARAMSDPAMTHVIFIDSDITWDPIDIFKLIIADKPLVGGVYPLKSYNWSRLIKNPMNPYETDLVGSMIKKKNGSQLKDMITDELMIQHNLLRYNINYKSNTLQIQNNLAEVKHVATGFMLIKRDLLKKMQKAFPSTKYVDDVNFLREHENVNAYALFDCGVEEGHYFSEDWLFCHRWTKMGGDIYIDVSINLTHTGIEDYQGCYISTIM